MTTDSEQYLSPKMREALEEFEELGGTLSPYTPKFLERCDLDPIKAANREYIANAVSKAYENAKLATHFGHYEKPLQDDPNYVRDFGGKEASEAHWTKVLTETCEEGADLFMHVLHIGLPPGYDGGSA